MKVKFTFIAAFLAMVAFTATAQTDNQAPAAAKPQSEAPKNNIPVAEHYPGGQEAMYQFIESELKYPLMAKRNRIQGQCIIGVTLNEDGTLSNLKILKNIGGGCGEEALRVVRMLKFNAPGYSLQSSIPVNFKL